MISVDTNVLGRYLLSRRLKKRVNIGFRAV